MSVDCVIRNLTEAGAMLRVPDGQPIPDTFTLMHIPGGMAFEAKLSWRRGDLVGAEFSARHDLKGPVPDEYKALRNVWLALAPA
ncbi:MAG: hypothetical protein ACK41C_11475 [Phenylobacterium sp.]|uniref:hypothetical protein n=1 Tax=Phenylobacterium sp. TaxID=1871053 RepID=UPI00391AF765